MTTRLGEIDLHLVGEGRHEQLYEKLGAHVRLVRLHANGLSLRAVRTHDDAPVGLVGAEDAVRVRSELDQEVAVACSISLCIPATGMPTHSGRLSSS